MPQGELGRQHGSLQGDLLETQSRSEETKTIGKARLSLPSSNSRLRLRLPQSTCSFSRQGEASLR